MSNKGLKYAIDIAKHMDMEIKLIRIIPSRIDDSVIAPLRNVEHKRVKRKIRSEMNRMYANEYKKLEEIISLANSSGVEATSLVVEGEEPGREILSIIKQSKPYIVVIGSRRLQSKGLSKIVALGSVAKKVAENSRSPVLLVR